jgi:hypothetical protein
MRQWNLPISVEADLFAEGFVPRGDTIDFEVDKTGLSAGTIWVRIAGQWVGFVIFYDCDNDQFDFGSDCRFTHNNSREQLPCWLLAELAQNFPLALLRPEHGE